MTQASGTVKWGDRVARDRVIRQAATELLARDGFGGLNMRAVAAGAGISLGAVYRYYPSKEELYASLYAERLEHLAGEITAATASEKSLSSALITAVEKYIDVYRIFGRELNIAVVVAGQSDLAPETSARLIAAAMGVLGTIPAQIARFEPDLQLALAGRERFVIQLVWVLVNGLAEHFGGVRHSLLGTDRREFIAFAAETFVAGLRGIA
ncbi:MAG: TetR/AcrR family transcriptional regulator [Nocardiaceae bacterium]|nr:TetR/AcrR family transcriptional regulator [Nocardiaceae bacterium]